MPEPLLHKHLRLEGLSRGWRHTSRTRFAVVLSAGGEIWRARLPLAQRVPLLAAFAAHWAKRFASKVILNPFGRHEDSPSR